MIFSSAAEARLGNEASYERYKNLPERTGWRLETAEAKAERIAAFLRSDPIDRRGGFGR